VGLMIGFLKWSEIFSQLGCISQSIRLSMSQSPYNYILRSIYESQSDNAGVRHRVMDGIINNYNYRTSDDGQSSLFVIVSKCMTTLLTDHIGGQQIIARYDSEAQKYTSHYGYSLLPYARAQSAKILLHYVAKVK
jgi:hypothetical protein